MVLGTFSGFFEWMFVFQPSAVYEYTGGLYRGKACGLPLNPQRTQQKRKAEVTHLGYFVLSCLIGALDEIWVPPISLKMISVPSQAPNAANAEKRA